MTHLTLIRNERGCTGKLIAQPCYGVLCLGALVETTTASLFLLFSLPVALFYKKIFQWSVIWLSSASFTVVWSSSAFCANLFVKQLIANESQATTITKKSIC